MARCLVLAAVLLSGLALLASGCGGGSSDKSEDTTAWANDLCSAITAWQSSLSDAVDSLQGQQLTRSAIEGTVDDAKKATDTFVDEVTGLGTPDTQAGAEAKDLVNELAADLSDGVDDIQNAVKNGSTIAGTLTTVTNTLTTMGNELTSTLTRLGQLDAQGEIEDAFKNADACKSLTG